MKIKFSLPQQVTEGESGARCTFKTAVLLVDRKEHVYGLFRFNDKVVVRTTQKKEDGTLELGPRGFEAPQHASDIQAVKAAHAKNARLKKRKGL